LIIALSRYGGLRCPSEHLALGWQDINWGLDRFLLRSSKTEHHEDVGERWVPIFPELRPFLEDCRELEEDFQRAANSGAVVVQNAVQQPSASPRNVLQESTQEVGGCEVVQTTALICDTSNYPRQDSNLRPSV
jgi:hypothetical protein